MPPSTACGAGATARSWRPRRFKVRVVHCFWTFATLDEARTFLADAFGDAGGVARRGPQATTAVVERRDLPPLARRRRPRRTGSASRTDREVGPTVASRQAGRGAEIARGGPSAGPCYARPDDLPVPAPRRRTPPRRAARRPRRGSRGPHLGPVRITPLRVTLLVALLGGIGFLAYATLVRDQLQVPLMATGFAVCGIVFAVVAVLSVRRRRPRRS